MTCIPKKRIVATIGLVAIIATSFLALAQGPFFRRHTATSRRPLRLVPADQNLPDSNRVTTQQNNVARSINSNGIPDHDVGRFPNRGNPHAIRRQSYQFQLPAKPQVAQQITPLHLDSRFGPPNMPFGVAVNGLVFDPGTAEFWNGDRSAGWNYEALGGAVPLGIDENHAHVQPNGAYHYHGLPTKLLKNLDFGPGKHSPLIGWAADGFPIYAVYAYSDPNNPNSKLVALRSSYRLKKGKRPGGTRAPTGKYDGTFVQDYEFVAQAGDLDECNGRYGVTPEFPDGTYAYFLTENWPVIPRSFRGTPVNLRDRTGPGGPHHPPGPRR